MCEPTEKGKMKKKFLFLQLIRKEFLFNRYDEYTGKRLYTHDVTGMAENKKLIYRHEYRGVTLYLKEIVESGISIVLIVAFVYLLVLFAFKYLFVSELSLEVDDVGNSSTKILSFSKYILNIAGGFLILDSLLLIAALISSPGIDETIDSISVTIGGVLLIFVGRNEENFLAHPELILKVVLPLAFAVVVLILTKHKLRKMNNTENYRKIDGIPSDNIIENPAKE
jgi:hypothetical protein